MSINENELAVEISKQEGKKVPVDIAQIKEILRITLDRLACLQASAVLALIEKHAKK